MHVDSPEKHFSTPDSFDNGFSCVYQLHTSSTLITGYSIIMESSSINCSISLYTKNRNESTISHISDMSSPGTSSSIPIDNMEDVYIVAKSTGKNSIMSLTANVQTSLRDDRRRRGRGSRGGSNYGNNNNCNYNNCGSSSSSSNSNSSSNGDSSGDGSNSTSSSGFGIGGICGVTFGILGLIGLIFLLAILGLRYYRAKRNGQRTSPASNNSGNQGARVVTVIVPQDTNLNLTFSHSRHQTKLPSINNRNGSRTNRTGGNTKVFYED